jgi:ABC-2 type transport system permease protein
MNNLIPLMQREWLQHRFAWALLVIVPLALAVLPLSFGQIEFDGEMSRHSGPEMAMMLGTLSIVITAAVMFLIVWVSSLFITSGLARRDHADRSIEFWLSLPTGHAQSLAAPLIVHLILVPAAALLLGLLAGYGVSFLLVARFAGVGEWFDLPWGSLLAGTLSLVARVLAGLPLATLWLMPLILLSVLAGALFKRWGLPLLAVALGVGGTVMQLVFGQPIVGDVVRGLGRGAGLALAGASGQGMTIDSQHSPAEAVASMPAWAAHDLLAALGQAASPLFVGSLLVSAGLFLALVLWRQRGASSGL